jgi:hypothetical protein
MYRSQTSTNIGDKGIRRADKGRHDRGDFFAQPAPATSGPHRLAHHRYAGNTLPLATIVAAVDGFLPILRGRPHVPGGSIRATAVALCAAVNTGWDLPENG